MVNDDGTGGIFPTYYIVTSIGDQAFRNCSGLTSVTISDSVTSIGISAFQDCSGLTSVTIGNSVTRISGYAFGYCSGLTSITIPNSVTSIGWGAFSGCIGLTEITIPNSVTSIGSGAFYGCSGLTEMTIPFVGGSATATSQSSSTHFGYIFGTSGYTLGTSVSYNSTTYYIPARLRSVTVTGDLLYGTFYGCSMLTSVTISNSVTSIGSSKFQNCSGLTSFTIPNTVTSIGFCAFSGCSGLRTVTIGNSVTTIGQSAFYGCSGLTSLNIPNSVTSIGGSAFSGCSSLTSINIPNSVTSIGNEAFAHCSGLTEMTIPFVGSNATSTGQSESNLFGWIFERRSDMYTTDNCSGCVIVNQNYGLDYTRCYYIPSALRTVTVTGGSLQDGAFYNCSMLTSVTIGNGVTSIGIGAFGNCTGITTVNFNATNCTEIGTSDYHVFSECTSLTTINIGNDVTNIPNGAFYGCSALTTVNYNATNCTSMGSSDYPVFANCTSLASLNIGNSVRNIPAYAFKGCSGLPSVTIPNSVTSIGSQAFAGCNGLTSVYYTGNIGQWCGIIFENAGANPLPYAHNLYINNSLVTELDIPQTVTEIKPNTFCGATCLTSVTIPSSVTSIGEYAFSNCNMISVTLPNSITSISNGTFDGCSRLASLTIPNSITSIGNSAFNSCSGIRNLIIGREVASIGSSAFEGCSGIITMKVKAEYPPNVGAGCFNGVSTSAIVKVPCNSEPYYNAAQYWNQFTNIQGDFEYEITVSSSNSTMGNVTVTQEPSCTNSTAIIMATANSGYRFLQWNDGNTDNPRTVTVTGDVTYTASFTSLTDIEENSVSEIALFPNPANDILNITSSETISEIEIVNVMGQVVKRIEVNADNAVCDVNELKAGVYMVRIRSAKSDTSTTFSVRRFVKE